jgi:phosphate:Na+ symporter
MEISMITSFIGGIGLFLLGMKLMTDGLKLAAGNTLRHILASWTRTPLRGLFSGFLITSLVQSSSAVTIATIGFVNAGLLTMLQTIYVTYGSNIGTTMTGWLVAMIGLKLKIEFLALPMVGVGMLFQLTSRGRRAALGEALAGFGLFFLGINVLKEAFVDLGGAISLETIPAEGVGVLLFVGIGFVLTFLMQSSSAAMAITLTAAMSGIIPLTAAAAIVIGTNIGTTSTAALAVIGATSNAKRTAAAHVLFNLITGVAAILLLHPLMGLIAEIRVTLGLDESPAVELAMFHSTFNIFGVLLLWFFTPLLVRSLMRRFRSMEEDRGQPKFLDKNVVATPALGMQALIKELHRIGAIAREMGAMALSTDKVVSEHIEVDMRVIRNLNMAVDKFGVTMQHASLSKDIGDAIPVAMRVSRYYQAVAELAAQVASLQLEIVVIEDAELNENLASFHGECVKILELCDPEAEGVSHEECDHLLEHMENAYHQLKSKMLIAGASEKLKVKDMVVHLDRLSQIRRMTEQSIKGAQYMLGLMSMVTDIDAGAAPLESEGETMV